MRLVEAAVTYRMAVLLSAGELAQALFSDLHFTPDWVKGDPDPLSWELVGVSASGDDFRLEFERAVVEGAG